MFSPFIQICSSRIEAVRSRAMSQPLMPKIAMAAGADQMRIEM